MHYATEDFHAAEEIWTKATSLLKAIPSSPKGLMSELMNNLGCVQFENDCSRLALKSFEEALVLLQKNSISSSYLKEPNPSKETRLNLSIVKSNIGYVHLRTKNIRSASSCFKTAIKVRNYFSFVIPSSHV